jgi:hypothetical protein
VSFLLYEAPAYVKRIFYEVIADALFDFVHKATNALKLVFIPTAANVEIGRKDWLIKDPINIKKLSSVDELSEDER